MSQKPLLSICIPTYNRASYLKRSLDSIVSQDAFQEDTEIIISDNASTDSTRELCETYCTSFHNIKYYRNEKNLIDNNQALCIERASGRLRKLSNDSLLYKPGAIQYILNSVRNNNGERPVLFFNPPGKRSKGTIMCPDMDTFVKTVSYNMTWIASIAFWEEDCMDLSGYYKDAASRLPQVSHLLRCLECKKALVCNVDLFETQSVYKKDLSYGLYRVFYENLLSYIYNYVKKNQISESTYERVRKDLLLGFFSKWVVETENDPEAYLLSEENLRERVYESYRNESYYMEYKMKLLYKTVRKRLKRIKHSKNLTQNGGTPEE